MRVVTRLITKRYLISRMLENIEMVVREQASAVDTAAIAGRLQELHGEMSALVKLNLTTGIDDTWKWYNNLDTKLRTNKKGGQIKLSE